MLGSNSIFNILARAVLCLPETRVHVEGTAITCSTNVVALGRSARHWNPSTILTMGWKSSCKQLVGQARLGVGG